MVPKGTYEGFHWNIFSQFPLFGYFFSPRKQWKNFRIYLKTVVFDMQWATFVGGPITWTSFTDEQRVINLELNEWGIY